MNFFQQLDYAYKNEIGNFEDYYFNHYLQEYFDWLETSTGVEISTLGTGAKNGERIKLEECLNSLVSELLGINLMLSVFLPETSEKIFEIFEDF